ncbi:MAG: DUF2568 domain-containing protein [Actinomycetia bacterium]|nr:DUF2568 domain-containing protein [Actinomycetes bacterium]
MKINLALRLLLEVGALVSFAGAGWALGSGWTSWALAFALPAGAATIWGAVFFSLAVVASVITVSPIVTVAFAMLFSSTTRLRPPVSNGS